MIDSPASVPRAVTPSPAAPALLERIAHELRGPLGAMLGFAELLHDEKVGPLSAPQKSFLADILAASRQMKELLADLEELGRASAGVLPLCAEPVALGSLLAELRATFAPAAAARRIVFAVDLPEDPGRVALDPRRLARTLDRCLSQALALEPEGGSVTLRLVADGEDGPLVEIEMHGVSLSPVDRERLFEPFARLDSVERAAENGLVLALARALAQAQGCELGVRAAGRGTLIFLTLRGPSRASDE